ncbi:hypothetical protein WBJ53_29275 [Spirosoma sp. SC4-14]|uniref:hypothetical protein n=1 Tax=Spirosoma sp. SC4-14 TaxID=3128900 RepID=UPI0030D14626
MSRYEFFLAGCLLCSVGCAKADMIRPGSHSVHYCFRIANSDQYPDYVFLAYYTFPSYSYSVIQPGQCVEFYRLSRPVLCAIARADFDENMLINRNHEEQEETQKRRQRYFENNPAMLRSTITISSVSSVEETDPLSSIEDVLTVRRLTKKNFAIAYESVRYTFADGSKERKIYIRQDKRPEPSVKAIRQKLAFSLNTDALWGVGFVSIAGLLFVRYIRNRRK